MSGSGPIYEYQRELTAQLEQVMRERDEARAEVARLQKIVDDTALGINAMIQSALNHPANCSVFDNGRCTCGKENP